MEGRPTKSGKRYKSLRHAQSTADYLNDPGRQSHRYRWEVSDDGLWELRTFDREPVAPRPGVKRFAYEEVKDLDLDKVERCMGEALVDEVERYLADQ